MKPQSDEALPARSIGKQLFTKVLSVILIGLLVLDLYFNQTLFADVVPYVWTMAAVQLICHIANLFVLFLLLSATEMFQFGFLRHLVGEFGLPLAIHVVYLSMTTWLNLYRLDVVCDALGVQWWDSPRVNWRLLVQLQYDDVVVYGNLVQKFISVLYYEESCRAAFRLSSPWFFSRESLVEAFR